MLIIRKENLGFDEKVYEKLLSIGFSFPQEYVTFLKKHNGGILDDSKRRLLNPIEYFYDAFDISYMYSVVEIEKYFIQNKDDLPDSLLAIGENAFGDVLCLKVLEPDSGKVYIYCQFESPGDGVVKNKIETYENINLACNSFDEMCTNLVPFV